MRTDNGLSVDVVDRIAHVTLDRPERLNALSTGLVADLVAAFDGFSADDDVWAVLLTGSGDRAFSAGIDLKEVNEADGAARWMTMPMAAACRPRGRATEPHDVARRHVVRIAQFLALAPTPERRIARVAGILQKRARCSPAIRPPDGAGSGRVGERRDTAHRPG